MKRAAYIFILLLLPTLLPAQQLNLDSLWSVWNNKEETEKSRVQAMRDIVWGDYLFSQPDSAFYFAQLMYDLAESINDSSWMTSALNIQGISFQMRGNTIKALDFYFKGLKIDEAINDMEGVSSFLGNIGSVFVDQKEYDKALTNYKKSLEIDKKNQNEFGITTNLLNIGNIYLELEEYSTAFDYYKQSLKISERIGDQMGVAIVTRNIGIIYSKQGNQNEAIKQYEKSYKIAEEIEDYQDMASALGCMGTLYQIKQDHHKAIHYNKKALDIAQKGGFVVETKQAAEELFKSYKAIGDYTNALKMYELHILMRDSIQSEENQKEVIRQQYKYEYEKQAAADSVKAAEAAKVKDAQLTAQRAENARQQQQAYYLYGGLALALLFGGFIFNRFRVTNKQKKVIEVQKVEVEKQREFADSQRQLAEEQKEVVEEKNREIIDSINYAKRLQEAILPPQKLVKEYLQQSFILYKPKDIVAGDFYWMETVGDTVYFAAADCTGHGVPGAMVSVVCSNALSKALIEENITDVGKLLDRTRELVVERFGRSEENIQDGMDIALCALNTKSNELHYAGANNPLWVIRKGATEVEETKADKQPIGKYDKEDPFTAHSLQLNQGDSLYIFSDGYPDQFGGDKGKKYKTGAMKKFLLSIQEKDMASQRQLLNEEFENWKGELEQIDDVCVIGVRI